MMFDNNDDNHSNNNSILVTFYMRAHRSLKSFATISFGFTIFACVILALFSTCGHLSFFVFSI